jgi:hypothetical protein
LLLTLSFGHQLFLKSAKTRRARPFQYRIQIDSLALTIAHSKLALLSTQDVLCYNRAVTKERDIVAGTQVQFPTNHVLRTLENDFL